MHREGPSIALGKKREERKNEAVLHNSDASTFALFVKQTALEKQK
jgi:hypothetical protein